MGIRFRCHHCEFELHVKDFQGGRRGRCPECGGRFRVPSQDAEHSISLEEDGQHSPAPTSTHEKAADAATPSTVSSQQPPGSSLPNAAGAAPASVASNGQAGPSDVALPAAITEAPDATWYVRPTTGGQYGPAPGETFMQWLVEGRISRESLVWRDGWPEWLPGAQAFSDYFGPDIPSETYSEISSDIILPGASPEGVSLAAEQSTASPTSLSPVTPTLGERNRLGRKQQKRRRYIVILSILTVLFICLIVALVVVLLQQS